MCSCNSRVSGHPRLSQEDKKAYELVTRGTFTYSVVDIHHSLEPLVTFLRAIAEIVSFIANIYLKYSKN